MLGIEPEYTHFDADVILGINSAFFSLHQLGIGPKEQPFNIEGASETWSDFSEDINNFLAVKQYVFLKTKLVFDPPLSGTVISEYNNQLQELAWRLNAHHDMNEDDIDEKEKKN
jgi:hypothetical protein